LGRASEEELSLHAYRLTEGKPTIELTAAERDGLVRELGSAVRIKDPASYSYWPPRRTSQVRSADLPTTRFMRKYAMWLAARGGVVTD
jgi:hypothetical protein